MTTATKYALDIYPLDDSRTAYLSLTAAMKSAAAYERKNGAVVAIVRVPEPLVAARRAAARSRINGN